MIANIATDQNSITRLCKISGDIYTIRYNSNTGSCDKTPSPEPFSTTFVSPVTIGTPAFFAALPILATTLNELAQQSAVGMKLREKDIPVDPAVTAACELLGLDPLYVANEGKLICICKQQDADQLLKVMQDHPLGKNAAIIGEVVEDQHGFVQLQTNFGGNRIVDWLVGEQLPRIC